MQPDANRNSARKKDREPHDVNSATVFRLAKNLELIKDMMKKCVGSPQGASTVASKSLRDPWDSKFIFLAFENNQCHT
jgi:hypothetical protein